ncbi:hypothetical protein CSOJ01_01003 [Colletotrichum sojae]|uniref:Uncharacterized protein n=1 Tax=Colletotrichum sojae TaxID=2175907 RepID=A0A8H6N584_9PEZI|nr:hypothetical protein CSOJ01_01003 [Colletotrichum sojae]
MPHGSHRNFSLPSTSTFAACSLADPNQRDPPAKPTQGRAWPVPLSGHDGYQHQAVPRHPVSNEASLSPTALAPGAHRNKRKTVPSRTSATLDWSSRSRHSEYGIRVFVATSRPCSSIVFAPVPVPITRPRDPVGRTPRLILVMSRGASQLTVTESKGSPTQGCLQIESQSWAQSAGISNTRTPPHHAAPVPLTPLPRFRCAAARAHIPHSCEGCGTWESGLHKVRQMMQPSPSPPAVHPHLPTSHAATICTRHGEPEVAIDMNRAPKSQASQAHPTVHFLPCLVLFSSRRRCWAAPWVVASRSALFVFPSAVNQAIKNHKAMVVNQQA